MSKYAHRATQIVAQLYNEKKARKVIELISNAKSEYAIDRILRDARNDKIN